VAETLFYLLAAGALGSGALVVAAKNPLFSVLALLGSFFCVAGIYLLAGFQFLAATQILVYAGAIMVLFLFVIMLLNLAGDSGEEPARFLGKKRLAVAIASAALLAFIGVVAAGRGEAFADEAHVPAAGIDELESLATVLFSRYALPFEAASLLLLATMVAVLLLAKRQRPSEGEPSR
jgi:NADH-quinone oxidoreductase subunit J